MRPRGPGLWLMSAVVLSLTALPLQAQQPNRMQRTPLTQEQRQELERRVRQQFDQRMREDLGLNADEQARFQRLVQDFRDRRLELSLERRQLQVRLRREGRREDLTDDEAQEMLDQTLELADREAALFREEQAAFLEILSPAQLVQLYELREALTQRLRRLQGSNQNQQQGNVPGGMLGWAG